MNERDPIEALVGGLIFVALPAAYFLILGYKGTVNKAAEGFSRWGQWQLRHPWFTVAVSLLLGSGGVFLFASGISHLLQNDGEGIYELGVGVVHLLVALSFLCRLKKTLHAVADTYERHAQWIRRNPWIAIVIGSLSAGLGLLMIISAASELLG